jgi:hypothetical protein
MASGRSRTSSRISAPPPTPVAADAPAEVEFIDVGCGDGRSTYAIRKKLKIEGRSLGIDRSGARLPDAPEPDVSFAEADFLSLPNRKQCRFVTLINVLPGAAGYAAAFDLLRKASIVSRDFVYVSQPNFDSNSYLVRLGMKTHYSGAAASRFQGTAADYFRMARALLEEGLIQDFSIIESGRIRDSSDEIIHPLETPADSGPYDPAIHRYKSEDITFAEPIYRRLQIVLARKPAQLGPISKRLREFEDQDNVIISSAAP